MRGLASPTISETVGLACLLVRPDLCLDQDCHALEANQDIRAGVVSGFLGGDYRARRALGGDPETIE